MGPMKRAWARWVGGDVAAHFPFATHRAVLAVLLALALGLQAYLAVDGARPDRLIDQQLLSNESDANSVVTVQRESFNVALALGDWAHGATSARDVQVARALLSQRLSVVTRSLTPTSENVGAPYLTALADLDRVILALDGVADADRPAFSHAAAPVVETFLTETRALNETFQQLGREQIRILVDANRERQRLQGVVQLVTILLLGLLSLSIVVAVGRGYRSVSASLAAQSDEVRRARRDLELVRLLDHGVAALLAAVDDGAPAETVRARLERLLDELGTGRRWTVRVAPEPAVVPLGAANEDDAEVGLIVARAASVLDALTRREAAVDAARAARRSDPLTGLANRLGFVEGLERLCATHAGTPVLVCLLDVDRFGEVNGALGFAGADRVLVELAQRLEGPLAVSSDALLARMAADEFAVALPLADPVAAGLVVDGLRAAGTYLSSAGGLETAVSVSSGEAYGVAGEVDATELLRRAAVAMLLAKQDEDRRGHVVYDPAAHDRLADTLVEEIAVRNALRAGEFVMHYQPIVDLATGVPVGLESLVRWDRPGVGLVPPASFLPVIARSGFAVEFGFEVITEVLGAWKRSLRAALNATNGPASTIAVNVDAVQLADPGFATFVLAALDRVAMEPRELVLELTEHTAIDRTLAPVLGRLRAAGVRIAVDDFGSGYSSLGQSTRLPVDVLKLDRSFITGLVESAHDPALFADLAGIARTLGVGLVAEGIETEEVEALLRGAGIRTGQGYLYSPALPELDAVRWIRARAPRAAPAGGDVRRSALTRK